MNNLKNYDRLKKICTRVRNVYMIPFFISLFIMIVSFLLTFVESFPAGLAMTVWLFATIFFIIYAILWPIKMHGIKKSIAVFTPQQLMMINNEMATNKEYEHFIVTSQAVVNTSNGFGLVPMANILWVYKQVTTTRMYGVVPVSKSSVLIIGGRDQSKYMFNIKNNAQVVEFLQSELMKYRWDILFGFDKELKRMFDYDINRMIAIAYDCAQRRQQEMQAVQYRQPI